RISFDSYRRNSGLAGAWRTRNARRVLTTDSVRIIFRVLSSTQGEWGRLRVCGRLQKLRDSQTVFVRTTLSAILFVAPLPAPSLAFPNRDPQSPQEQSAAAVRCSPPPKADPQTPTVTGDHRQSTQNHHSLSQLIDQTNTKVQQHTPQQVIQCYAGSIISAPQHQALLPHPSPLLQPAPPQNDTVSRGSPSDDSRQLDIKKRPGGYV
ncbi:hypothetical protein XENOCAPTIV_022416, partial [Xenoophorus captivus]